MTSVLYDLNSVLIVSLLFVLIVLGIELGYRVGQSRSARFSDLARTQVTAIQASMLGILALLLGFSFSESLRRFDARSEAVVHEANAIGTAYLRAQLVAPGIRERAIKSLRAYLDVRAREAQTTIVDPADERLLRRAQEIQNELWEIAKLAAAEKDTPSSALFVQSINDLIDSFGLREEQITRHVPEAVILLLFATFVLTGMTVGISSGLEEHRPTNSSYVLAFLIILLVFIIIDLDRPRRGLIEVPQDSLLGLRASL